MAFDIQTSAAFTRPNDTTAYASGDLVANSTTAASVVPISFADTTRNVGGSGAIRRARIFKSSVGITTASFRLHLYSSLPVPANGDNAAWSTPRSGYLGALDGTMATAFTDAAQCIAVPVDGTEITYHAGGATLYGLLEARSAYTPVAQETFTVELEVFPG